MPDALAVPPPSMPLQPKLSTRAYTTLFWFLVVGQILATFTALMAVATLLATTRPVVRWRFPLPTVTTPGFMDTTGQPPLGDAMPGGPGEASYAY